MPNYETNMINYLKRNGLDKKYNFAGIYCIKIDDEIVYIGKSYNMLKRVVQHYVNIQKQSELKYRILAEAHRKGHKIGFDVLYYATQSGYNAVKDEIGTREGEYIRQYKPVLNTQIPKETDYRKFNVCRVQTKDILNTL